MDRHLAECILEISEEEYIGQLSFYRNPRISQQARRKPAALEKGECAGRKDRVEQRRRGGQEGERQGNGMGGKE